MAPSMTQMMTQPIQKMAPSMTQMMTQPIQKMTPPMTQSMPGIYANSVGSKVGPANMPIAPQKIDQLSLKQESHLDGPYKSAPSDKPIPRDKLILIVCAVSAAATIIGIAIFYYAVVAGIADAVFARGLIMLWYPPNATITSLALAASAIPVGWAICDGTLGTPDLRGRFVLMAADTPAPVAGAAVHPVMSAGGEETHALTVAEMPTHNHITAPDGGYGGCLGNGNKAYSGGGGADFGGGGNCFRTSAEGGSKPHNTLPPFYTLIYIMRV